MSIWRDSASTRIADGKNEVTYDCSDTVWRHWMAGMATVLLQEPAAAPVTPWCSVICTLTRHIFRQIFPFVMSWLTVAFCSLQNVRKNIWKSTQSIMTGVTKVDWLVVIIIFYYAYDFLIIILFSIISCCVFLYVYVLLIIFLKFLNLQRVWNWYLIIWWYLITILIFVESISLSHINKSSVDCHLY